MADPSIETWLKLLPEVALAVALFWVVRWFVEMAKQQQIHFDEERKADGMLRDKAMQDALGDLRKSLEEFTSTNKNQTGAIIAELKSGGELNRAQAQHMFNSVCELTRDAVAATTAVREGIQVIQIDLRELKQVDRGRTPLPPPRPPLESSS